MADTIFDKIVRGEIDAYKVWETEKHLAFLTKYPNTPGLTIVIPKTNLGDYVFGMNNVEYLELMQATKKVANILEKAFDTPRIALVFEGTGVAYVHAKLYPLHGELAGQTEVWSEDTEFIKDYRGYLTTIEGPEMSSDELEAIQAKIVAAAKS
ncbi:MAG: HIT family protein [Candidatus Saccharimonadales bacterium]